jgi:hypothetical protein
LQLSQSPASTTPTTIARLGERIPEFDGLRGIAISLVLVFHRITGAVAERWPNPLSFVKHVTQLGWSGVDLFFRASCMAGFCLVPGVLPIISRYFIFGTNFVNSDVCRVDGRPDRLRVRPNPIIHEEKKLARGFSGRIGEFL